MKNKKSIYFLLPTVLLIWGALLYQFFSYSNDDQVISVSSGPMHFKPLALKERDTFSIDVHYRDPFLGKMYSPKKNNVANKKQNKVIKKDEPLVWPSIIYKGIVSDVKERNKVFMLLINGKTFLMRKGDIENEIILKEGSRESISVKYKGKLDLIALNK